MIKKLLSLGYVDLNKVILDSYKELNLSEKEAVFLMHLVSINSSLKNLSSSTEVFSAITQKSNFSFADCEIMANKLIKDGVLDIELNDDGREVYDLSPFISSALEKMNNPINDVIRALEKTLCRPLSNIEIQETNDWLDCGFTPTQIETAAVDMVNNGKTSFKYLNGILTGEKAPSEETPTIDKRTEKELDCLFTNMKKALGKNE